MPRILISDKLSDRGLAVLEAARADPRVHIEHVGAADIRAGALLVMAYDVLLVPGGGAGRHCNRSPRRAAWAQGAEGGAANQQQSG